MRHSDAPLFLYKIFADLIHTLKQELWKKKRNLCSRKLFVEASCDLEQTMLKIEAGSSSKIEHSIKKKYRIFNPKNDPIPSTWGLFGCSFFSVSLFFFSSFFSLFCVIPLYFVSSLFVLDTPSTSPLLYHSNGPVLFLLLPPFLAACTRLYNPICLHVHQSVRLSVCQSLLFGQRPQRGR